jgi:hypothetical protein
MTVTKNQLREIIQRNKAAAKLASHKTKKLIPESVIEEKAKRYKAFLEAKAARKLLRCW